MEVERDQGQGVRRGCKDPKARVFMAVMSWIPYLIVTGGLLWWGDFLVIGCYSITSQRDEVRLYPREARLDNAHCSTELVEAQVKPTWRHFLFRSSIKTFCQVLLLNRLGDRLVVYCANSHISLYHLYTEENDPRKYN